MHRKLYRVHATTIQENEERVVVEESFPPKISPHEEKETRISDEQSESSSSGTLENWVIKLEQSINIFLTVKLPHVCDNYFTI